jgi:glycyl-tRNA synthetase
LDSLAGLFAVGLAPSGSADPFGLRRAALGIVSGLIEHRVSFDVRQGLAAAAALLPVEASAAVIGEAAVFVTRRLEQVLKDRGYRYDLIEAVLAARGDDPYRAQHTLHALQAAVDHPQWLPALTAYARAKRIVRPVNERYALAPERLSSDEARQLYESYLVAQAEVNPASDADILVNVLIELTAPINRFFDKVMVMADDPAQRAANLGLLQHIVGLADGIADLTRVQGF